MNRPSLLEKQMFPATVSQSFARRRWNIMRDIILTRVLPAMFFSSLSFILTLHALCSKLPRDLANVLL